MTIKRRPVPGMARPPGMAWFLGRLRALADLQGAIATPADLRRRVRRIGFDAVRVAAWSPDPRPDDYVPGRANLTVRRADPGDGPLDDGEPVKVIAVWVEQ